MRRTVAIDCFPDSVSAYDGSHAVVAVDVFRATTTAVTAVALGRRCYPVGTIEEVAPLAARLSNSLAVGELGGNMPFGFHLTNSPVALASRTDVERPMILLSTSGTRLICGARDGQTMYVACLRNYSAQVRRLAAHHDRIAVIGAGARGEFREEDQLCCAWIAQGLIASGYEATDAATSAIVDRWRGASVEDATHGKSAQYLRESGQLRDIDFVLEHVDDLDQAFQVEDGEIVKATAVAALV